MPAAQQQIGDQRFADIVRQWQPRALVTFPSISISPDQQDPGSKVALSVIEIRGRRVLVGKVAWW